MRGEGGRIRVYGLWALDWHSTSPEQLARHPLVVGDTADAAHQLGVQYAAGDVRYLAAERGANIDSADANARLEG